MARRFTPPTHPLGDKLAPKIALLVKHVMNEHLRESGAHRSKLMTQAAIDFFKTITDERDEHMGDLLSMVLDHPDTHPAAEKMLKFIHSGKGELAGLLSSRMLGSVAASGLGSGLANILAPINQDLMLSKPYQIPDPATVAAFYTARLLAYGDAYELGKRSGLDDQYITPLIEASWSYPGLAQLLELLRRKLIEGKDVATALRRQSVPEDYIAGLIDLYQTPLSPEDLALTVLKGISTEGEAVKEAEESGINAERFKRMVLMIGEPPGPEQLGEAYRRKLINRQRFEHGIRQSRIRDEWIDVLLDLRFSPASPSDAIRGVVQNHLEHDKGKQIAEDGGLRPEDFDWLVETAGNPPGVMQMIDLWRRGKMSEGEVKQGIRESRVKNKYIDHVVNLKRVLPAERQIVSMVTHGAITEQEGAKLLHERGYDDVTVRGFIHSATSSQAVREKALGRAEVVELYYDHAISEARAVELLHGLGYTAATAKLVLSLADLRREKALRQAAMGPIRSSYIAQHIDETEAAAELTKLGLPHKQVDFAMALWKHDRESHRKVLTEAQIVAANVKGLFSDATAESRLMALGYTKGDARVLLDLEKTRTTPAP